MRKLTCVVVDDSELDRMVLVQFITRFSNLEIKGVFSHPEQALHNLQDWEPDIIFLDIDMPGMSGLELRRKVAHIPVCVFTTSHPEYAVESFELETLDYLVKPFSADRFSITVERIEEYFDLRDKAVEFESLKEEKVLYIKVGYHKVRIDLAEVSHLKAFQNYSIIFTPDKKHHVLTTLGALLEDENFSDFIRVHRSYAVQKRFIKTWDSREVTLTTEVKVPIGRSYKETLENLIGS